jgi:hypothetical protein
MPDKISWIEPSGGTRRLRTATALSAFMHIFGRPGAVSVICSAAIGLWIDRLSYSLVMVGAIWAVIFALYFALCVISRATRRRVQVDRGGIRIVHLADHYYKYSEITELELHKEHPTGFAIAFKRKGIPLFLPVPADVNSAELCELLKGSTESTR